MPDWPHAPIHRLSEAGTYMVTVGTYQKQHFFSSDARLKPLHDGLLKYAKKYNWCLEAWAVFSNHYHFVGHSPKEGAESLRDFISHFHGRSAAWLNQEDKKPGRQIWHNYWDTKLDYHKSYLSRLNYVHNNPVKHGLAEKASSYPYCSAHWFEKTASRAQVATIYSFDADKLNIYDDF